MLLKDHILEILRKADNGALIVGRHNKLIDSLSELLPDHNKDQISEAWLELYNEGIVHTPPDSLTAMMHSVGIEALRNRIKA